MKLRYSDVCQCRVPHDSGRRYFRLIACGLCNRLIVGRSRVDLLRRMQEESEAAAVRRTGGVYNA